MIELAKAISYRYVDLPNGPRLNFICPKGEPTDLFSISIAAGYGGVHLALIDESGAVTTTPRGTAHFIEHLLIRTSLNSLSDLQSKYGTRPNAVVTPDQSIWYAKYAVASGKRRTQAVCDVVRTLLSSLSPEKDHILRRIEYTKSDVLAEIRHRHSQVDYQIYVAAMAALYHTHPIRFDLLGDDASVTNIQPNDVEVALRAIRRSISSITIVGVPPTDQTVDAVKEAVLDRSIDLAMGVPIPTANHVEPAQAKHPTFGIRHGAGDTAFVCMGIKLPPFRSTDAPPTEIARMYALSYLVGRELNLGITGIINSFARAWLVTGAIHVDNSLFYADEENCYQIKEHLRMNLLHSLAITPRRLEVSIMSTWATIMETQTALLRICHHASRFGYTLSDFISTFNEILTDDLDRLRTEIAEARDNISFIFTSDYAGLL